MFGGLWLGFEVTVWVSVSLRVNSFRDFFSLFLRSQYYSMLTVRHSNHTFF